MLRSGLRRVAGALAARAPGVTYPAAGALGGAVLRPQWTPDAAALAKLMPYLTPDEAGLAARRARANLARDRTLAATHQRVGLRASQGVLLDEGALAVLEPPLLLCTFHVGPLAALPAALERVPGEVLSLRRTHPARHANVTVLAGENQHERVRSLHAAVAALRAGKSVMLALDAGPGAQIEAPLFGGSISLNRGAFVLSRLSGVPLTPLVGRWEGARVRIVLGQALCLSATEEEAATAAAAWLESYLRDHPGEVTGGIVKRLRRSPPSPPPP